MIASSLTGLVLDRRAFAGALRIRSASTTAPVAIAAVAAAVAAIAAGWYGFGVHPAFAALGVALSGALAVPAMQATGETDTTPAGALGGVAQIAVGGLGASHIAAPIAAGGTVNGVAAHAATMLNAWKAGAAVDARPSRLVIAQLAGIAVGAASAVAAFWLIDRAYGIGSAAMPVPGAASWKLTADAVVRGISGAPDGAALAALIAAAAGVALGLVRRRRWAPSPIAIGIGFLLPLSVTASFAASAIGFAIAARRAPAWFARRGAVLGAGLIVGEGLAGVAIAAIAVALG
jgi:uncharacterized oligopeptide transporter (OPT) family protein